MAFAPPISVTNQSFLRCHHRLQSHSIRRQPPTSCKPRVRTYRATQMAQTPSSAPSEPESASAAIPGSLSAACEDAVSAAKRAMQNDITRMFVEIDTTGGDATYTMLKNSLPITRMLVPYLSDSPNDSGRIAIILPDSGAAALAQRDWASLPEESQTLPQNIELLGMEQSDVSDQDAGVMIVVPRASEVEKLQTVVDSAAGLPVLIVNPDLVDMGVTGLSLNARRLRTSLIDAFEVVYYLKVFNWGVLLRAYPGKWGVWVDDPQSMVGFRLVAELDQRPSLDDIEEALQNDGDDGGTRSSGLLEKVSRFLKVYMKG